MESVTRCFEYGNELYISNKYRQMHSNFMLPLYEHYMSVQHVSTLKGSSSVSILAAV